MSSSARFALVFAPLLALLAVGFGAFQLYEAFVWLRSGGFVIGVIYALMGVGGFALGIALWSVRRRMKRPAD